MRKSSELGGVTKNIDSIGGAMATDLQLACERFDKALLSLLDMNTALREDLDSLLDAYEDDNSNQVLRRSFVRASWAYVEAITHAFKSMTSIVVNAKGCVLEPKEVAFLEQSRMDTLTNIKGIITLVAKVFNVPKRDSGGGTDWRHVEPSIKVRNRLVHPKSVADLQVTDAEWEVHRNGFVWLVHAFDGLLSDINDQYSQSHQCSNAPAE
jgi:hypothetical protein